MHIEIGSLATQGEHGWSSASQERPQETPNLLTLELDV
jgi:hypothetical protein